MTPTQPTPALAHAKRQQVVTQVITASSAPTAGPTQSRGFPVTVAVPALVGGMAAAIAGFLIFWWISRRRRREKRLRWERHQRRMARKRENASGRPSLSSNGHHNSSSKMAINEKASIPPVPVMPKQPPSSYQMPAQDYNYESKEYDDYAQQPVIEQVPDRPQDEHSQPKKPSRSAARVAAAEQAAETTFGDPNTRYQPKKPSPLALKAQEKHDAQASREANGSSDLEVHGDRSSGQWGVALGSPGTDMAYQAQVLGNDPYLPNQRGKSGMYSHDPYAAYHGDAVEEVDYHQAASDQGLGRGGRSNWV